MSDMVSDEIKKLAQLLIDTKSFSKVMLAHRILEVYGKNSFNVRTDGRKMDKIRKRCYKIFLSSIDSETAQKLCFLDSQLEKLVDEVEEKSGWFIFDDRAELETNFINQHDPEFATHDTFTVRRYEDGFHVFEEDRTGYNLAEEKKFYDTYEKELDLIHTTLSEKERIMRGDYTVIGDNVDAELVSAISGYLGYRANNTLGYSNIK